MIDSQQRSAAAISVPNTLFTIERGAAGARMPEVSCPERVWLLSARATPAAVPRAARAEPAAWRLLTLAEASGTDIQPRPRSQDLRSATRAARTLNRTAIRGSMKAGPGSRAAQGDQTGA